MISTANRSVQIEEVQLDIEAYPEGPLKELARQRLQILEGEELIERAVAALGGDGVVDSVRMVDMRGFVQSRFLPIQERARGRLLIASPDLLFLEQEDTKTVFAVRGGDGYSGINGVIEKAALEEHRELLTALAQDPFAVLQMRRRENFSVVASESEGDQSMVGITIGIQPYVLGIEDSGRITSISFTGTFFESTGEFYMEYSDHREMDGVEVPFQTIAYFDDAEVARIELTSIRLNEPLDARPYELFEDER